MRFLYTGNWLHSVFKNRCLIPLEVLWNAGKLSTGIRVISCLHIVVSTNALTLFFSLSMERNKKFWNAVYHIKCKLGLAGDKPWDSDVPLPHRVQLYPRLHQEWCQKVEEGGLPPLLNTDEVTLGVLCLFPGFSLKETWTHLGHLPCEKRPILGLLRLQKRRLGWIFSVYTKTWEEAGKKTG